MIWHELTEMIEEREKMISDRIRLSLIEECG